MNVFPWIPSWTVFSIYLACCRISGFRNQQRGAAIGDGYRDPCRIIAGGPGRRRATPPHRAPAPLRTGFAMRCSRPSAPGSSHRDTHCPFSRPRPTRVRRVGLEAASRGADPCGSSNRIGAPELFGQRPHSARCQAQRRVAQARPRTPAATVRIVWLIPVQLPR